MAAITIRNIDESLKKQLRLRAARHERSMEEEVRVILKHALLETDREEGLGTYIHACFAEIGGVELDIPPRKDTPRKAALRK